MSEHEEQVFVFEWAKMMEAQHPELALLHAIPNGAKTGYIKDKKTGRTYSPEKMRLNREGQKKGVPDICWPVARHNFHGLYIEMKHGKNKPTPEQEWWLDRLAEQGYLAVACWEAQDTIDTICEYGGIEKPEFFGYG